MNFTRLRCLTLLCVLGIAPARAAERPFDQWADDFAAQWVRANPQFATQTQYFSGAEQDANDRQLVLGDSYGDTYGVKAAQARAALARRGLRELAQFSQSDLTPSQRTSAAVIQWTLDDVIASAEFATHRFVFEQIGGLHLELVNFLTTIHPIRHRRDVENYLARLSRVAPVSTKASPRRRPLRPRASFRRASSCSA